MMQSCGVLLFSFCFGVCFTIFIHSRPFSFHLAPFMTLFSEVSTGQIVANILSFPLNINFNISEGKNEDVSFRIEVYKWVLMNSVCGSVCWLHILALCLPGFGALGK